MVAELSLPASRRPLGRDCAQTDDLMSPQVGALILLRSPEGEEDVDATTDTGQAAVLHCRGRVGGGKVLLL